MTPVDCSLTTSSITVPALDNDITVTEVEDAIKGLKSNKTSRPDGVSPGIFKLLPDAWVIILTQ